MNERKVYTKLLVCGGRNYQDKKYLFKVLDCIDILYNVSVLIQGGANGADYLAKCWAKSRNKEYENHEYKANWTKYKNRAGPIRNKEMYYSELPDIVVCFPGGVGTDNMKSIAYNDKENKPIIIDVKEI